MDKSVQNRAPIVAILGHVDHGKTSLLDKIREANVQAGEVGGITQKISVFTVDLKDKSDRKITFIDTPGHEAFDLMRTRGGSIADVVLLIVAADDGLMPQTLESIEIIKSSPAHPIVVITKSDLPNKNVDKIKRELASRDILVEGYGGQVPIVEVSAKTGENLDLLLETILLTLDVEGLVERGKLYNKVKSKAFVLESIKDKSKGYVSSVVVVQGEMKRGDWLAYKKDGVAQVEKIKGFIAEDGSNIESLAEGFGGKVIGVSNILDLGNEIFILESKDEKLAKEVFSDLEKKSTSITEEIATEEIDLLSQMFGAVEDQQELPSLSVVIKSSSEGSLEAIKKALANVNVDGHKVKIQHASVGDITLRDVETAEVSKSILIGFEVGVDQSVIDASSKKKVLIRNYEIIYKIVEEVNDVLTMMSAPKEIEEELGIAEIRQIFTLSDGGMVLGGRVKSGMMKQGAKCYIVRDDEVVGEGKLISLRSGKSEIKEAQKGADFGLILQPVPVEAKEGDEIHAFKVSK